MECNFKFIDDMGKEQTAFWLKVECVRYTVYGSKDSEYGYRVQACIHGSPCSVTVSPEAMGAYYQFNTPEEAYAFLDKTAAKYPICDMDNIPFFNGVEM